MPKRPPTPRGIAASTCSAQTRNALGVIRTRNVLTKKGEAIGSWNERFADTDEDIAAYLNEAERRGYRHIVLAGHSLGAFYYDGFLAGNVPKDRIEGLSLLRMAVEKGNKNAKEILFRTARASFQRKSWMFSASRLAG